MKLLGAFLLCLVEVLHAPLEISASFGYSSSGSGSGSGGGGVNYPPTIVNCPVSTITEMVAPEIGTFPVNIGVLLTATDANADPITFRTMLNSVTVLSVFSENVIANASIETDGTFVVLAIDGGVLNPIVVTSTQFNISIVASDGMADSEPCVLSVVIQYLQAAECRPAEEVRSNSEQASSDPTATRQFFAVRVPLIVAEFGVMEQVTFTVTIADFMNRFCSADCDVCALTSNCATLLQLCGQFTSNEVILLDVFTVSDGLRKKRQLSIEVVTAVVIPQVLPIVGEIPLVPPEILIQAIVENAAEFENVTGTQLNGVPTQFFIPPPTVPPINFDDIAVIVLPIVVTVLVLALLGGIGAVLLIVYILKAKKKVKVQPVNTSDPDLRSQEVLGKNSSVMSLEPVE